MRAEGTPPAATPTLADQVSKLYELVAGYHATNLLEIARELGAGGADAEPGPHLRGARGATGYAPLLYRRALPYRIRLRAARP